MYTISTLSHIQLVVQILAKVIKKNVVSAVLSSPNLITAQHNENKATLCKHTKQIRPRVNMMVSY